MRGTTLQDEYIPRILIGDLAKSGQIHEFKYSRIMIYEF